MGIIWLIAAVLWGFAEATLFFIVPDVLLTTAAVRLGVGKALRLCLLAALGAVAGGLVMAGWAALDPDSARRAVLQVPAIGPELLARVQAQVAQGWAANLALGPFTGTPYKLYAVEAGAAGVNASLFAVVSFVARLPRFIVTTWLAGLGHAAMRRWQVKLSPYVVLGVVWTANYLIYFSLQR